MDGGLEVDRRNYDANAPEAKAPDQGLHVTGPLLKPDTVYQNENLPTKKRTILVLSVATFWLVILVIAIVLAGGIGGGVGGGLAAQKWYSGQIQNTKTIANLTRNIVRPQHQAQP